MLNFSLSELVGIVPFAGGSFGFVRCSLGPFWGFMVACVEMVVYMMYSLRTIQKVAQLVTTIAVTPQNYEPMWTLCAFISVGVFHMRGGNWFWATMIGCTIFTFLVLAIFMIGSFTFVDFNKYALDGGANDGFIDKVGNVYMENCYFPMCFFMGICALPLTSQRVKDAQVNVPKAIMSSMTVMSIMAIIVLFCVASQAPAIGPVLQDMHFVLGHGLSLVFGMPERYTAVLLMIPTYASATGFMFACKHQLSSMAESGLVSSVFKKRVGPNKVPVRALLFCICLQFAVYLVVNHFNYTGVFLLCCSSACLMYIGILAAFITFKYKFEGMQRQYVSPVGVPGAVLGICVFGYILIGTVFFQNGNMPGPVTFLSYLALMVIYYFSYVQYVQFFSREEQDRFMKAYILNANKKRKGSKWIKMMTSMFLATGLDKIFLRSTGRKNGPSTMTKGSKSRAEDPEMQTGISLKTNKVVDVAMCGAVDTVSTRKTKNSTSTKTSTKATGALTWSGKPFNSDCESRKAFQLLNAAAEDEEDADTIQGSVDGDSSEDVLEVQLREAFPEHFVLPSSPASAGSVDAQEDARVASTVPAGLLVDLQRHHVQPLSQDPCVTEMDLETGTGHKEHDTVAARPAETTLTV